MWKRVDKADLVLGVVFAVGGTWAMPDVITAGIGGAILAGGVMAGIAIGRAMRG